jgi:hypothetical protein
MTDELREENQPDEEEVEGHSGLAEPGFEKTQADEDDDVEAHSGLPKPELSKPELS